MLRNHGHRTGRATRRARPSRPGLQAFYEDALYRALTDPEQLAHVTDSGLCHGWAGIYQTATRAAADALDPRLQTLPKCLGDTLAAHAQPSGLHATGLINGDAGTALALTTYASQQAPITGWDSCLLINWPRRNRPRFRARSSPYSPDYRSPTPHTNTE